MAVSVRVRPVHLFYTHNAVGLAYLYYKQKVAGSSPAVCTNNNNNNNTKIVRKMRGCLLLFAKQTARCTTGVVRYHCALPIRCGNM